MNFDWLNFPVTIGLAVLMALLAIFCGWRGAQPPKLMGHPRMVPWRVLMIIFSLAMLVMLAHMVTLLNPSAA